MNKAKKVKAKKTSAKTRALKARAPKTGKRIIAKFHPQVWMNDYAVECDPWGPVEWDVTNAILAMPREEALDIQDDQYESDELRELSSAPAWIRDWGGPFSVEVEASIEAFFKPEGEVSPS